jgi:acetyl-CoA synthetase
MTKIHEELNMSQPEGIPAPPEWAARAHIDDAGYDAACERAKSDPEGYWRDIAGRLDWIEKPIQIKDVSFDAADLRIRWYADGVLNASDFAGPVSTGLPSRLHFCEFVSSVKLG